MKIDIKKQIIHPETAKLFKEWGFNQQSQYYWVEDDLKIMLVGHTHLNDIVHGWEVLPFDPPENYASAYTATELFNLLSDDKRLAHVLKIRFCFRRIFSENLTYENMEEGLGYFLGEFISQTLKTEKERSARITEWLQKRHRQFQIINGQRINEQLNTQPNGKSH